MAAELRPKLATAALLIALVAGTVLAGAPRPPAAPLWALGLGLSLLAVFALGGRPRASLALPALSLGALSLLQLVPLPHGVRALLSSESTRMIDLVLGEAGHGWRALAVDPALTLQATARAFGAASAALLAAEAAVHSTGRSWLRAALAGLFVLMLALGLATTAGWHLPWLGPSGPRLASPLRNANHLGALLAAILPVIWALCAEAIEGRTSRRVWLVLVGVAGNVALFATASRGAILVGVATQMVVLWSLWRRGKRSKQVALAVGAAMVVATLLGGVGLWARLQPAPPVDEVGVSLSRPVVWAAAWPVVRAHALVGIGRGALPEVLPRYAPMSAYHRYDFIENQLWQLFIDFGALGLGALAAVMWAAVSLVRQRRHSRRAAAALWGLVALAVANLVDFSWELPLVATVAAILAALGSQEPPVSGHRWPRLQGLATAVGAVTIGALALSPLGRTSEAETGAPCAPRLLERHPLDGEVVLRCLASGSPEPSRELDRALLLLPYDGRAHAIAARLLVAAGQHDQAVVEARVALEHTRWVLLDGQVAEVLDLFATDDDRAAAAVPDRPITALRLAVAQLGGGARPALAMMLATRLQLLDPTQVGAANILLASAAQRRDTNAALVAARALLAADPSPAAPEKVAAILPGLGARAEAFALLIEPPTHAGTRAARARAAVTVAVADPPAPTLWPQARAVAESALAQALTLDDKALLHDALAELCDREQQPAHASAERAEANRLRGR